MNPNYMANLSIPSGKVDVVLDTDAFCEIDDQFAISYMLNCEEKLNIKGIYAAPFLVDGRSKTPREGMEKSYKEILTLLKLANREDLTPLVLRGCTDYLDDEKSSLFSEASANIVKLALEHSPQNPLYVIAIACLTDIASALLMKPEITQNIVIVWLGGHSIDYPHTKEFNMFQDIAAARVVFKSEAPLVQLPCKGVVSHFTQSVAELEYYLRGKNALCDYLLDTVRAETDKLPEDVLPARVIWDVTAVAWLMNDNLRFMRQKLIPSYIPEYDGKYSQKNIGKPINYVYSINRAELFEDMVKRLAKTDNLRVNKNDEK